MLYKQEYASPLGTIILLSREEALVGVWFAGQKYVGAAYDLEAAVSKPTPVLTQTAAWLTAYFAGERPDADAIALAPETTAYRRQVLALLRQVPYGETITYKELAARLFAADGKKSSSPRAIGTAVGHNPISLLIPCHRVVGSDGSLTGYAGGLDRKLELLALEGVDRSHFSARRIDE